MRRTHGFTLLETLVALAILAIALSAAFRAVGSVANSYDELRQRSMANWVAENRLAEIRIYQQFPTPGTQQYTVAMGTHDFALEELTETTPNALFRRITVTVRNEKNQPLTSLSGYAVRALQ